MAFSYLASQSGHGGGSGNTVAATVTALPAGTAGLILVQGSTGGAGLPGGWTVTDNASGNTYTNFASTTTAFANFWAAAFSFFNSVNGPTTFTGTGLGASSTNNSILIFSYSGVATASAVDGHNGQVQTGVSTTANAITTGTFNCTIGDLLVSVWSNIVGTAAPTAGTTPITFTLRNFASFLQYYGSEDGTATAGGATAGHCDLTSTSASDTQWFTAGVAFKPSGIQTTQPLILTAGTFQTVTRTVG
jgi:hypothetical protein